MNDSEHLKVFLNPLAFVPAMGTSVAGAPSDPTPESVLDFLCTPGVDLRRCGSGSPLPGNQRRAGAAVRRARR